MHVRGILPRQSAWNDARHHNRHHNPHPCPLSSGRSTPMPRVSFIGGKMHLERQQVEFSVDPCPKAPRPRFVRATEEINHGRSL